jgi:hypothetical protein
MKISRYVVCAAALAALIAIVATLPMFGVRLLGVQGIVLALPALMTLGVLAGNAHAHIAIATLLTTWIIYLALFLVVLKIWRGLRAK